MNYNESNWTVYIHIFPNNKVYIGTTSQIPEYRWRKGKKYSSYIQNEIQKYGWNNIEHKILYTNLTKEQAGEIEKNLIQQYKSNQSEYGYNLDSGGFENFTRNQSTLDLMSKKMKGRKPICTMKGKKHTEEAKRKMTISRTGKKRKLESIEKTAEKVRKKVNQYDLQYNFIKTWKSITEASKTLKIKDSDISRVCKGKRKKCGGYIWRYADESYIK